MTLEVSVIIVNYNTFELTSNCIRSIIKNTNCLYEIILVDNASTEKDPDSFKQLFPQITLIKSSKNIGFAKGNNLGIAVAKGEYILLLNSDTILINNAIDLSLDRIKRNGKIGALSCRLENTDGTPQGASNEFVTVRKNIIRAFRLQKVLPAYQFKKLNLEVEHETDWVWGTFFLFPSHILKYMPQNKLPDNFFMYGEDRQWCYRFKKMGYSIIYFPAAKIQHLIGASSVDKENDRFVKYFLPNEYIMYKIEKGSIYAVCLLLSSAFLYLSSLRPSVMKKGVLYIKVAFKGLLGFI